MQLPLINIRHLSMRDEKISKKLLYFGKKETDISASR